MDFRSLKRTWITAEIGVNHEGDVAVAEDLIAKAAAAGADAVKFQTYVPENYISAVQPERLEAARGRALSHDAFRGLAEVARDHGVVFFSTPLSADDADFLDDIVPLFKVASGELTWIDFIRHIAGKGKPMIISTGLGLEDEIARAVDAALGVRPELRDRGELMLMHCVSAYPTPDDQANLANIRWLRDRFGLPVGYSDHTIGSKACELAIAAGAVAIEKHFTYRKEDQAFRDHQLSANPRDMTALIAIIRDTEVLCGRYARRRGEAELENMSGARRSVAAATDIPADTAITQDMLTGLRPLLGIPIEDKGRVVGRRLRQALTKGALIREDNLVAKGG